LGHREGRLVPFEVSDDFAKEQCALKQQPFSPKRSTETKSPSMATWESTHSCLRQLLLEANRKDTYLPLSDVKRLFLRHFDTELNEAALGYTRVHDLLQDPRLHDVCTVHAQGGGQMVVRGVETVFCLAPRVGPRLPCMPGRLEAGARVPQILSYSPMDTQMPKEAVCLSTCPVPAVSFSREAASGLVHSASALQLCQASVPELVSPGATPRDQRTTHTRLCGAAAEESDVASTVADSSFGWSTTMASDEEGDDEPFLCVQTVKNTFIAVVPESVSGAHRRTRSEPRSVRYAYEGGAVQQARIAPSFAASAASWAELSDDELANC